MALISYHPRTYDVDEARSDRSYARLFTWGWITEDVRSFKRAAEIVTRHVWTPMVFRDGRRRSDHFVSARWLALDFDSPEYPLAQALNEWCDTTHLIGLTKSHQRTKGDKPPCDRFRLLVPFEREITSIDEYVYNYDIMVSEYGADSQAKDPARLFFPCTAIVSTESMGSTQPVRLVPENHVTHSQKEAHFAARVERYKDAKVLPSWVRAVLETEIPSGKRNNAIYGLAKDLTVFGLSTEKITSLILASKTYAGHSIPPSLSMEISRAVVSGAKAARGVTADD